MHGRLHWIGTDCTHLQQRIAQSEQGLLHTGRAGTILCASLPSKSPPQAVAVQAIGKLAERHRFDAVLRLEQRSVRVDDDALLETGKVRDSTQATAPGLAELRT